MADWQKMSLAEQLGNVGGEVHRALKWRDRDQKLYWNSLGRAFDLLDRSINDERWSGRRKELVRARELLGDTATGGRGYNTSLEELDDYFLEFATAARLNR